MAAKATTSMTSTKQTEQPELSETFVPCPKPTDADDAGNVATDVADAIRAADSGALLKELQRRGISVDDEALSRGEWGGAKNADAASEEEEEGARRRQSSSHVVGALRPKDALSDARAAELDAALAAIGVESSKLLEGPPLKAYNSYVRPRESSSKKNHATLSARNAAHQIGFLQRHEKTRRETHLRNSDAERRKRQASQLPSHPITLILDNVRSAENVGSIFRTADCARCRQIITCGFAPHPLATSKLAKTAAGAETVVPHRHFENALDAVTYVRDRGALVWALETHDAAVSYTLAPLKDEDDSSTSRGAEEPGPPPPPLQGSLDYETAALGSSSSSSSENATSLPHREIAIVLGNEVAGVDADVIATADAIVEIPTYGTKNSFNVACVAGIIVFDILRRWEIH